MMDLNHFYREHPALYELDTESEGFEWINSISADECMLVFLRKGKKESEWLGAVKVEKMPWRQFIVPVDKMKEATEGYQFSSIPTLVVIAPDGTIQCETNEADEIDEFLSRNLN